VVEAGSKGDCFYSASTDKSVKCWSLKDCKPVKSFGELHSGKNNPFSEINIRIGKITAMSVSKDENFILTGSANGAMKLISCK
jgi:hypothetical protein